MATKTVVVHGNNTFFSEQMDETAVPGYVSSAKTAGYYTSPDGDIYIAFDISSVVVQDEDWNQSGRNDADNF